MAFAGRNVYPPQELGYSRGSDFVGGGSGAGAGMPSQGTASMGQGLGSITSMAGDWEPSVLYLLGLVVAELIVFHILGRVLSK